ncbi:unnamed protein product [Oppiella nova]|uniref:Uncharacterized protein n=1 Tax=Oppiella nova TaxID=334625 RepID=A0A7R9LSC2_9ACAR|nr:unnamed protein product [Oppiella nova]CAG2166505.1 unnamed protein product [Oppiella nova]
MPENNKEIGKIGGGMFILILIILFFAAHGGSNEMMYLTLAFVFIIIALFSYGFWSSVSKGEGIWQYWGKQNLQHQQISNPNYHYGGSFRNYKSNPNKAVHICAPPKMGGARLNIYTIPLNPSLQRNSSLNSPHRPLGRTPSSAHRHNYHHNHNRSSFRRKPDTNEEEVKVEVYRQSDNKTTDNTESKDTSEIKEIQISIPSDK